MSTECSYCSVPSTCDHWTRSGARCTDEADVWMFAPDGKRVPGGKYCPRHADACITEYREKLGEEWTARPCYHAAPIPRRGNVGTSA